ncbi:MAG: squalene synthase HpnC [Planctomycetota bacterium]
MSVIRDLEAYGPQTRATLPLAEAKAYVRQVTRAHGENFSVVSRLLPRELRGAFFAVYAFCRWADDLADAPAIVAEPGRGTELLHWWREELAMLYAGRPRHPVFVTLRPVAEKHGLPERLFADLIDAFVQDQTVARYATWDTLMHYCTRSANPVGRLVLMMFGVRDDVSFGLSDATCTALQLTNFWQDLRRDILERGRIYLPGEVAEKHGLSLDTLERLTRLDDAARCGACALGQGLLSPEAKAQVLPAVQAAVADAVGRTRPMFARGRELWPRVKPRFRGQLKLFTLGGEAVLRKIERRGFDTWTARPRLNRAEKAALVGRVLVGRLVTAGRRGPSGR